MTNKKQVISASVAALLVIALIGGIKFLQISRAMAQNASFTPPPEAVTTIVTTNTKWQDSISLVGSLSPVQGSMIRSEEPGKVVKIDFESDSYVAAGDLLVELDTSVEAANLSAASARMERARKALARIERLKMPGAMSDDARDQAQSDLAESSAEVDSISAIIKRKRITAPFSGRVGIRQVNVGDYLLAGAAVVPLHDRSMLYLDSAVPQNYIDSIKKDSNLEFSVDSNQAVKYQAKVVAIDSEVDQLTRQFKIRALFDNKQDQLRPGMFAQIRFDLPGVKNLIAIPNSSINFAPYGDSVYVVEKSQDGKSLSVRQQIVTLGGRRGNQIAILNGINVGEEVVTSGVFKLRPGAVIVINNSLAPDNNPQPQVTDS